MIQISMDGPNVNISAHHKLQDKMRNDYGCELLSIGSCGLHKLHNAFKAFVVATRWDVDEVLSALHKLFKDTPARRADYEAVTNQCLYPLKFVKHRWVENAKVCQRAVDLLPHIKIYVRAVTKGKVKHPGTKSFEVVQTWVKDPFSLAKLQFVIVIAKQVEKFLTMQQTDAPMIPFLHNDLEELLLKLMRRVLKSSIVQEAKEQDKLTFIDVKDVSNQRSIHDIDLGSAVEAELRSLSSKSGSTVKNVSELDVRTFKINCRTGMEVLISKMKENSPLEFSLTKSMKCLDPWKMVNEQEASKRLFKDLLLHLTQKKHITISTCDDALEEYETFLLEVNRLETFQNFNRTRDRVDTFFHNHLAAKTEYARIWEIVQLVLLLSHGQASIERGFSLNKQASDVNMEKDTLVARRIIKDHVIAIGGVEKLTITKELLKSCRAASSRYKTNLEEKKAKKKAQVENNKRKAAEEELLVLKRRRDTLEADAKHFNDDADKNSEKAERLGCLRLLSTANASRQKAKEKQQELEIVQKEVESKQVTLQGM